jgi:fructose-1-phosphate kinase PfkB-like protein
MKSPKKPKPRQKIGELIRDNPAEALRKFGRLLSHQEFLTCAKKDPKAAIQHVPERVTEQQVREWAHHDPRILLSSIPNSIPLEQLLEIVNAFRKTTIELLHTSEGNLLAKTLATALPELEKSDKELHHAVTANLASGI